MLPSRVRYEQGSCPPFHALTRLNFLPPLSICYCATCIYTALESHRPSRKLGSFVACYSPSFATPCFKTSCVNARQACTESHTSCSQTMYLNASIQLTPLGLFKTSLNSGLYQQIPAFTAQQANLSALATYRQIYRSHRCKHRRNATREQQSQCCVSCLATMRCTTARLTYFLMIPIVFVVPMIRYDPTISSCLHLETLCLVQTVCLGLLSGKTQVLQPSASSQNGRL